MAKKKRARPRRLLEKLSPQHLRFVEEYLVDLNGTQAAIRAGYGKGGASVRAAELLKQPLIKSKIDEAIKARSERTKITQDMVLRELYQLCVSSLQNYGSDGSVMPDAAPEAIKALASIKRRILMGSGKRKLVSVELRLWDKTRALNLAMRHLGMLNDKLTISVEEELQKVITDAAADFDSRVAGVVARLRERPNPRGSDAS